MSEEQKTPGGAVTLYQTEGSELTPEATIKDYLIVQNEGGRRGKSCSCREEGKTEGES